MTLEILDPARRLGDRDVPVAERTAVYASNHPEVGWGHNIIPHVTDEETEAQRAEVTCSTCHGQKTAEAGCEPALQTPNQWVAFWPVSG